MWGLHIEVRVVEVQLNLRRISRRRNGRQCSWQPEMSQDAANHGRVVDELDAVQPALAMRADEHLVAEDAGQ